MEIVFPREFSIKISLGKEGAEPGTSRGHPQDLAASNSQKFPWKLPNLWKNAACEEAPASLGFRRIGTSSHLSSPFLGAEFPGMNHCLELVKVSSPAAAGENLGFGVVSSQEP